jgi:hypothetical protein
VILAAAGLTVLFWGYCGGMSLMARGDRAWTQLALVHALSAAVYFALASSVAFAFVSSGHPLVTVPLFVLILIFGTLLGHPWIALLIGEYFDRFRAVATGTASMKVAKTYDQAQKAEHEGDLDLALRLYGEEAAADARDPEPLRRMAEIHVQRGQVEEALGLLGRVLGLVKDPELRTTLSFRRADLFERAGRRSDAERQLEAVAQELPGTPFERCARERLGSLRRA